MKTFLGGIYPREFKEFTEEKPIKTAKVPHQVVIPLLQHTGIPCEPLVKVGDKVKIGQKIGESKNFLSAPVHSSISGKVTGIEEHLHPLGEKILSIIIKSEGEQSYPLIKRDWQSLSSQEIKNIIREAGIVGLGGAAFSTYVKLSPPQGKKIDTVILNGAECEPYLTCDYRLMLKRAQEIITGLQIIMRTLDVTQAYIGIESNKPQAIKIMEKCLPNSIKLISLKTKYPQGAEKLLIKAILNREVPPQRLPFNVGVVVFNVATALAIKEAVIEGKPLIERVITVSGEAVTLPQNLKVRIGTLFSDVIEECGGFSQEVGKIIMGGPMMGIAQSTLSVPVIKETTGILTLSKQELLSEVSYPCVRCGRCIDICPLNLMPALISIYAENNRFAEAEEYGALDCNLCAVCAYTCPSKLPLIKWIKYAKTEITKRKL